MLVQNALVGGALGLDSRNQEVLVVVLVRGVVPFGLLDGVGFDVESLIQVRPLFFHRFQLDALYLRRLSAFAFLNFVGFVRYLDVD